MSKNRLPGVRFFGKPTGLSGYSQATRYIAKAFASSCVPVSFQGKHEYYKGMSTCDDTCQVDFYIQTPPFSRHKSRNYKIGYFYWEADRLPNDWGRDICSSLDEVWVPCELTKRACRKAGFRGPIEVLFTPRPKEALSSEVAIPLRGSSNLTIGGGTYVFYSIFQWNERKGYRKLIRAFYEEFSGQDNVILVIKTNPVKHKDHGITKIKTDMLSMKKFSRGRDSSPIFMITESLSDEHISGLHFYGDCFVLPHHGEGWGMPIHDAMLHNSLVITTPYGGITEHLNDSNALLIKHKLTSVRPMNWNPYYRADQKWADPDLGHLRALMREAYGNQDAHGDMVGRAKRVAESMSIAAFSTQVEGILSQKRFLKIAGGTV